MAKMFNSPGRYIQGAGELARLGTYVQTLGKKALILLSAGGRKRNGTEIEASFSGTDCGTAWALFSGECCETEIHRLMEIMTEQQCDIIVGIGGGKILDTAKAAAYYQRTPVVICPTVASSDAPSSALSVVYTDEGAFERYLFLPKNPDMVLMDTAVIAASPVRLTVSGMGDALATYFEARACLRKDADTCVGGKATLAGMALAELCFRTLMEEGEKAKTALEAGACTAAVEKVVEANTLLSGLGFESGGLAGAHAIQNGLSLLDECRHMYHGEKVAFGTLAQLVLEDVPLEELEYVGGFCIRLGLPVTLAQLGIGEVSREKIMAVAGAACAEHDTMGNMPFAVTPDMACAAILAADAFGRKLLAKG